MARPSFFDPLSEERAERRFRLLAEAIPQIVWTTTADGYCDYTNRRWLDYSGMTAEESAGVGWRDAVHPEDQERHGALWAKVFRGSVGFEIEYRLRRADGAYRWFLARAEPIRDDEGTVVRWFGTCTDIDDRRREADEKLRRKGDRLRLAAEAAPLGYWDWDIAADSIIWSQSLEHISGTSPASFGVTIEGLMGLVHPDDRGSVGEAVRGSLDRGEPYGAEFRMIRPDGSYRWCLAKGQVFRDEHGRAVRMSGVDVDITARKEAEDRLRASEERFRASADTMLDCFAIYTAVRDASGEIVDFRTEYMNEAACRSNRMTREQQVGKHLLDLLPGHRESGLFAKYCRVVETGEPLELEEMFYEDVFDGERLERFYSIRVSKVGDGYVAAWRDITGRKRTERALHDALELARRVAEITPASVYIYDLVEGRPLYHNREIDAHLGRKPEAILTLGPDAVPALMHPDDRARFPAHLAKVSALADGEREPFEFRARHADGTWRWFLTHDSVFARDAEGRATQTHRRRGRHDGARRAEASLHESDHRLRKLADSDIIGVIFGDVGGGISYANDEYLRIIGYDRVEFEAGRIGWADVTPPEWLAVDEQAIARAKAGDGSCPAYEKEYVRKDGSRVPVLVGFTLFGDEGTVAFILDISERKARQDEVRRSEERLRNVLDGLFTFAGILTPEGAVLEANRPALREAGLRPRDVIGMAFEETYWWAYSADVQRAAPRRYRPRRGGRGRAA